MPKQEKKLTKKAFIAGLPSDMPPTKVIAKANAMGMKLTAHYVANIRSLIRKQNPKAPRPSKGVTKNHMHWRASRAAQQPRMITNLEPPPANPITSDADRNLSLAPKVRAPRQRVKKRGVRASPADVSEPVVEASDPERDFRRSVGRIGFDRAEQLLQELRLAF